MSYYDEIDLEDLTYAPASTPQLTLYTYPCPCGDRFEISLLELREGGEVAVCPGCSLRVLVVGVVVEDLPVLESEKERVCKEVGVEVGVRV